MHTLTKQHIHIQEPQNYPYLLLRTRFLLVSINHIDAYPRMHTLIYTATLIGTAEVFEKGVTTEQEHVSPPPQQMSLSQPAAVGPASKRPVRGANY